MIRILSLTFFLTLALSRAGYADIKDSRQWFEALSPDDRAVVQFSLIWTGHYNGFVDRLFSGRLYRAVTAYQASVGENQTGVLLPSEVEQLTHRGGERMARTGFDLVDAPYARFRLGLPKRLVAVEEGTTTSHSWAAADDSFSIETFDYSDDQMTFDRLFQRFSSNSTSRRVDYARNRQDFFVTNGIYKGRQFYALVHRLLGGSRGLVVAWSQERQSELWPVVTAMASAFNLPPDTAAPKTDGPPGASPTLPPPTMPTAISGTGFFVNTSGYLVTNDHVVAQCAKVTVVGAGEAKIVSKDPNNDLALLRVTETNTAAAHVRRVPLLLAEPVAVIGFPYSGILSSLNTTIGNVSALTGLGADTRSFQLTAAVQPGNSGGPVIDAQGSVVGVVQARLDDVAVLEKTKSIPQNVNFAIRHEILATFLSANNITFAYADFVSPPQTIVAVSPAAVRDAVQFTAQIICEQ